MAPTVETQQQHQSRSLAIQVGERRPATNSHQPDARTPSFIEFTVTKLPRVHKAIRHSRTGPAGHFALVCGTVCCSFLTAIVLLTAMNALAIASLALGATYLHDCPAEPHLPPTLIVLGALGLLICILDLLDRINHRRAKVASAGCEDESCPWTVHPPTYIAGLSSTLKIIQLALFLYMCMITFRMASSVEHVLAPHPLPAIANTELGSGGLPPLDGGEALESNYCDLVVYRFAFWLAAAALLLLFVGAALLLCVCILGTHFIAADEEDSEY